MNLNQKASLENASFVYPSSTKWAILKLLPFRLMLVFRLLIMIVLIVFILVVAVFFRNSRGPKGAGSLLADLRG
jgi:hypothetical protein